MSGEYPLKDLALIAVASLAAFAVLLVMTDSLAVSMAGGVVGGAWFYAGAIYGYGEAVGV